MQHLDEGLIHAWLDNALSSEEAARVAAHAEGCSECAAAIAEARGMIAGASRIVSALDTARGGVAPVSSSKPARSLWRRLYLTPTRAAIAATVLVALGSVFTLRHRPVPAVPPAAKLIDSPPVVRQSAPHVAAPRAADSARSPKPMAAPAVRPVQEVREPASTPPKVGQKREALSTGAPAPPAATNAMDAAVDSAKTGSSAAKLAQSELRNVPAGAAGAATPPTGARDQTAARAMPIAPTAQSAKSAAMGAPASTRFESTVLTVPDGAIGCYTIRPMVGDTTTWVRALPEQFALDPAIESGSERARGNVRVPSSAGRLDSVIEGSNWQQTGPNRITVVFEAQQTVRLQVAANGATAEASSGGVTRGVAVARSSCPR